MTNQKQSPLTAEDTVEVSIGGKKFIVGFPNVGQLIEIEKLKRALTNGKYEEMLMSRLKQTAYVIDLLDAFVIFTTIIPNLKKQLEIKSYDELDAFVGKTMVLAYKNTYLPFYERLIEELHKGVFEDEKETSTEPAKPEEEKSE